LKKPLFGYGANSHSQYKIVDTGLVHFHNLIVQSLVSVGLIGSVFIAIFLIKRLVISLIAVFKKIADDDLYLPICVSVISLLFMFLINSMAEVTILFQARFSMFIFWIMLGYLTALLGTQKKKEDPILEKAADCIDERFLKAGKNAK
jgi:O-antigen ligase